jgi:hypothetical protein
VNALPSGSETRATARFQIVTAKGKCRVGMKWRIYFDGKPTDPSMDGSESAAIGGRAAVTTGRMRGEPSARLFDEPPRNACRKHLALRVTPHAIRLTVLGVLVALAFVVASVAPRGKEMALDATPNGNPRAPAGLDSLTPLAKVRTRVDRCKSSTQVNSERRRDADSPVGGARGRQSPPESSPEHDSKSCGGVIYVWSPAMPLSRLGIADVASATRALNVDLSVVGASELYARSDALRQTMGIGGGQAAEPEDALVAAMIAAGATMHFPAILVHRNGRISGKAIVGYKTTEAYRAMIAQRLDGLASMEEHTGKLLPPSEASTLNFQTNDARAGNLAGDPELRPYRDIRVDGTPGAYFRWVPGHNALAYETDGRIHLLDLQTGAKWIGPGSIDFIPSPDGAIFVTPAPDRQGLEFYDAKEVFSSADRSHQGTIRPFFVDELMKDQYPSVGILGKDGTRTTYRVLTSWFDRVAFRDYTIGRNPSTGAMQVHHVRPSRGTTGGCANHQISLPLISPNGRELAGRGEGSGTTRIVALADDGRCHEVRDLGMQTGKVAWSRDGRRIAFAVPNQPTTALLAERLDGASPEDIAGLFVLRRDDTSIVRIPHSERLDRLVFPDFVAGDSVAYLISSTSANESWFRISCCVGTK